MGVPALSPYFQTARLARLRQESRERRAEWDAFFHQHASDVKARLEQRCAPYDARLERLREQRLQATLDNDLDEQPFRLGADRRRPQLWQLEGDAN